MTWQPQNNSLRFENNLIKSAWTFTDPPQYQPMMGDKNNVWSKFMYSSAVFSHDVYGLETSLCCVIAYFAYSLAFSWNKRNATLCFKWSSEECDEHPWVKQRRPYILLLIQANKNVWIMTISFLSSKKGSEFFRWGSFSTLRIRFAKLFVRLHSQLSRSFAAQ